MIDTDYLQTVPILRLQAAARKAGLAFRNGDLNKAGIIDRLSRHPMIGGATVAILKREDSQGPQPAPDLRRKPSADDWLDDDDVPAPKPAPSPVSPPPSPAPVGESFGDWRPAVTEVARAVTDLHRATQRDISGLRDTAANTDRTIATLKAQIEDLKTLRPLEVKLTDIPPIRIEGKTHRQFPDLLAWLHAVGRVILTGPAGTGKSRAAQQCAEALGLEFHIQTPFTQSYEFLGHRDAQGVFHETPLFKAYTRGGLCLMDEADSCAPDAFLPANPILDGNGFAMFGDGKLHTQHPDFRVILNMNTQGDGASLAYSGRNPLDGATIARFGGMLHWAVDPDMERSMAQGETAFYDAVNAVRKLMQERGILTVNATPRHTMIGARLLKSPQFAQRRAFVLEASLKNGPVADIWPDVLRLPAVAAFLKG